MQNYAKATHMRVMDPDEPTRELPLDKSTVVPYDKDLILRVDFEPELPAGVELEMLCNEIGVQLTYARNGETRSQLVQCAHSQVLQKTSTQVDVVVGSSIRESWEDFPKASDRGFYKGQPQYCSFDAPSSGNFYDSDAFDRNMIGHGIPSVNARDCGNFKSTSEVRPKKGTLLPWVAAASRSFLKVGGAAWITISATSNQALPPVHCLVENQVAVLYVSGHGSHSSGHLVLENSFKPWIEVAAEDVKWHDGLTVVFASACSLFDARGDQALTRHPPTTHHGRDWAKTGPRQFLGYRFTAPPDAVPRNFRRFRGSDSHFTEHIVDSYFRFLGDGIAPDQAWGQANASWGDRWDQCYDASVIDVGAGTYSWFDFPVLAPEKGDYRHAIWKVIALPTGD